MDFWQNIKKKISSLNQSILVKFPKKLWSILQDFKRKKQKQNKTKQKKKHPRVVHELTISILITYFSGMKIDPKYAFLQAFFLICLSCPFQNLYIWPKTHPFFQFCMFLHP